MFPLTRIILCVALVSLTCKIHPVKPTIPSTRKKIRYSHRYGFKNITKINHKLARPRFDQGNNGGSYYIYCYHSCRTVISEKKKKSVDVKPTDENEGRPERYHWQLVVGCLPPAVGPPLQPQIFTSFPFLLQLSGDAVYGPDIAEHSPLLLISQLSSIKGAFSSFIYHDFDCNSALYHIVAKFKNRPLFLNF